MGVVAVLGTGLLTGQRHLAVLNLLMLPLVVGALGVVIGTAPQQNLAVLIVLLVLVGVGVASRQAGGPQPAAAGAGVVLELLLAWGAVASSPPMPPAPTRAYTAPLDVCRPPFHAP